MFYNTSGFQSETLAKRLNGLVVYAEHRYFGESIPKDDQERKFLTVENALMDYANLLIHIREKYSDARLPAITFGGSYGGMLATWMRMKFPD